MQKGQFFITGILLMAFVWGQALGGFIPHYRIATTSAVDLADSPIRICALRVSFPPDENEATTGTGQFLMTTVANPCEGEFVVDPAPHNRSYFNDHIRSLANYYRHVSGGKVKIDTLNSEIFPLSDNSSYQINHPMAYYHPFLVPDSVDFRLSELLVEAVRKADSEVDFTQFDVVVIFHAGVGQDFAITLDPTPYDIPSAFMNKNDLKTLLAPDDPDFTGIAVENGTAFVSCGLILPESQNHLLYDNWEEVFGGSDNPCQYQFGLNGTVAFMFGFYLGLPSLYDTETGYTGVGKFGLMDQGSANLNGLIPAVPSAWERIFLGWETPVIAGKFEEVSLKKVGSGSDTTIWKIPINAYEYFLIENRCANFRPGVSLDSILYRIYVESGEVEWPLNFPLIDDTLKAEFAPQTGVLLSAPHYDYGLEGSGLLIWHIDESVINANLSTNRVNIDRDHRGVDLEEGDGAQDLGYDADILAQEIEDGWFFDPWFAGNDGFIDLNPDYVLDAGERVGFTPYTNPATHSNSYVFTGISVDSIGPAGDVMTFRIRRNDALENFPIDIKTALYEILPIDLNPDDQAEEILIINDSLQVFSSTGRQLSSIPRSPSLNDLYSYALDKDSLILYLTDIEFNFSTYKLQPDGHLILIDTLILEWRGHKFGYYLLPIADGLLFTLLQSDGNSKVFFYKPFVHQMTSLIFNQFIDNLTGGDDNIFGITTLSQIVRVRLNPLSVEVVAALPDVVIGTQVAAVAFINQNETPDLILCTDSLLTLILDIGTSAEATLTREQEYNGNLAFADIDGDGKVEIIAANASRIFAFNETLTLENNFPIGVPFILDGDHFKSELLTMDLDGDGKKDIIINTSSALLAFNYQGDLLDRFPKIGYQQRPKSGTLLNTPSGLAYLSLTQSDLPIPNFNRLSAIQISSSRHTDDDWICYGGNAARQFYYPVKPQSTPSQSKSLLNQAKTFCWPNPAKNNQTFIRYHVNHDCDITINIYDLAGDLVTSLKDSEPLVGEPNEREWNTGGVESGVYLAVVQAKSGARTDSKIVKILVVK